MITEWDVGQGGSRRFQKGGQLREAGLTVMEPSGHKKTAEPHQR